MSAITDETLKDLAQIYNQEGKRRFYQMLRDEYETKDPYGVFRKMKKRTELKYNASEDRFLMEMQSSNPDDVFLSMDELCSVTVAKNQNITVARKDSRPDAMEKLVRDLIGDRLLELSQYVKMDTLSKALIIDQTSLLNDGYQVIIH